MDAEKFYNILKNCAVCPHKCKVDRLSGQKGFCNAPANPVISSAMAHHGEEPPISGKYGSGTIFFTYCNMKCVYCQNYQISQLYQGNEINIKNLSDIMLSLQQNGCHNINLVSPTVWIPQILKSLSLVKKFCNSTNNKIKSNEKLKIPIVYNTGGYEDPKVIKLLDGFIEIYMPDIRYASDEEAEKYSNTKNYVKYNRASIIEMYRQVGDLKLDKNGIAVKGLLIRLLVLPNNIGKIKETLDFIKYELSDRVYLSIMAQYYPEFKAKKYPELSRRIYKEEYLEILNYAEKLGLINGWTQDYSSLEKEDLFKPDFNKKNIFKYYE